MVLPPQIAQAYSLVSTGRAREAVTLLSRLAESGDGPAAYQMAEWAREGEHVRRDLGVARTLYGRSAQAGLIEGARRFLALVAVGIGGAREWRQALDILADLARVDATAREQLALVQAMQLTPEGDPVTVPAGEVLSEAPKVTRFPALFTRAECRYLAAAAEPLFEPAKTVEEHTGRELRNPIRTSDTAFFPWVGENPAIHALNRRIAAASGTRPEQGEPLQVLRYRDGQEYRPHIDAIPGLANQRVLTMLVYLNDDYEGGETRFLEAGVTVRGKQGDALLFANTDGEGRPNQQAMHAGLPVTKGVKLLASRWIRERPVEA